MEKLPPTSAMFFSPVAIAPASRSIRSCQRSRVGACGDLDHRRHGQTVRGATPVVKTCRFIPAASCRVPQTKSLAGVAAKIRAFTPHTLSGAENIDDRAVPDLAIEPSAFSTILASPPCLLPGVVLALRSTFPAAGNGHTSPFPATRPVRRIRQAARGVRRWIASRTSVTSENMTLPPARTTDPRQTDRRIGGEPEKASLPAALHADTRSEAGQVSRRRLIQSRQCSLGHLEKGVDHGVEAGKSLILERQNRGASPDSSVAIPAASDAGAPASRSRGRPPAPPRPDWDCESDSARCGSA